MLGAAFPRMADEQDAYSWSLDLYYAGGCRTELQRAVRNLGNAGCSGWRKRRRSSVHWLTGGYPRYAKGYEPWPDRRHPSDGHSSLGAKAEISKRCSAAD